MHMWGKVGGERVAVVTCFFTPIVNQDGYIRADRPANYFKREGKSSWKMKREGKYSWKMP